jgi:hypothetical protein
MAFNSIVEGTLRTNAKMIAMGQSTDIQKMPRPKQGTQAAQRQATYTPSGTDVEKMLYPKNFKPRAFELSETKQEEQKTEEANITAELVEETLEEQKTAPTIIGDDDTPPQMPKQTEGAEQQYQKPFPKNSWESCKHYKSQGERAFCREYLGWCAKDRCTRPKY